MRPSRDIGDSGNNIPTIAAGSRRGPTLPLLRRVERGLGALCAKKPGSLAGLFDLIRRVLASGSELVAYGSPGDVDRDPGGAVVEEYSLYEVVVGVGHLSEVVVQPFAPEEPVLRKLPL